MALTKEIIEDKIEVTGEHRNVQVRTATVVKEASLLSCSRYLFQYSLTD